MCVRAYVCVVCCVSTNLVWRREAIYKNDVCFVYCTLLFIQVVAKDTNVMLVALAGKAVADLAKGLRKNFYPYSSVVSVTC